MKSFVFITAAFVWAALAAPSEADAFSGGQSGSTLRIQVTGGALSYGWYDRQGFYLPRLSNRRSNNSRQYGSAPVLPPRAILRSLRARQFCRITYPRLRRGLYQARARDAYGRRVRLTIDPFNGNILRLRYR